MLLTALNTVVGSVAIGLGMAIFLTPHALYYSSLFSRRFYGDFSVVHVLKLVDTLVVGLWLKINKEHRKGLLSHSMLNIQNVPNYMTPI